MERYPALKVMGHHLGGGLPFFWGRADENYTELENVHSIKKSVE